MSCDEGNLKPNKDWCEKVDATNNHNKGSMKYNDDSNSVPCHNSTSDAAIPVKSQSCTKRQWSLLEKILLLLLILACILILCLVTALLLQPTAQATGNWEEVEICDNDGCRKEFVEVCTTAGCVMASSDLQQAIDISVNPCDDFYSYACGQWNTVHLIPEDESSYGTFRMVRDKLRMQLRGLLEEDYDETQTPKSIQMAHIAYHSCMNETNIQDFGVTPLWNKMQTLGDWPMLSRTPWRPQRLDITELLANSKAMFGSDAFIYPYVYADGKDTTHHILHIDQGALGLQAREFYLNQTYFKKQITAYKDHAKATIKLFAKDLRLRYDAATERDIQKIIEFEVTLANLTTPEDKRRNHTGRYTKWSLEKLQQRVPEIDWTRYFEIILPPEVFEILNESTPIVVQEPKYLADMTKLVTHLDSK